MNEYPFVFIIINFAHSWFLCQKSINYLLTVDTKIRKLILLNNDSDSSSSMINYIVAVAVDLPNDALQY